MCFQRKQIYCMILFIDTTSIKCRISPACSTLQEVDKDEEDQAVYMSIYYTYSKISKKYFIICLPTCSVQLLFVAGFTTQRTRRLLLKLGLSQVHDNALYEDYYDYLEIYYSSKVDILPLKR